MRAWMTAFNRRLAIRITGWVGTMACAYAFGLLALVSLPSAIGSGSVLVMVAWVAQTFLQLVLLSVILLGSNLAAERTEAVILDTHAEVTELLQDVRAVLQDLADSHGDLHHVVGEMDQVLRALHVQE